MLPAAPIEGDGQPGERSREPDDAAATCHAVTGPITPLVPNLPVTAAVATPSAATMSRHGEPNALGTAWSTPASRAATMKCTRTASNRELIRRNQPRTVPAGTPTSTPIQR